MTKSMWSYPVSGMGKRALKSSLGYGLHFASGKHGGR